MISTQCPQAGCARNLKVPPEMAGRVLVCPGCGTRFQLPPRVQAIPLPTATATGPAPVPLVPAPGTHPAPLPLPTAPRKATPLPPPQNRSRDEEIDDPPPKLKGKRARRDRDEDIDDAPPKQSRRSRRDDDDNSKPQAKKTGGRVLVFVGGSVAVLLAISIVVGGCVLFSQPPQPKVYGKYGGIEIGSSGVKAVAVEFFEDTVEGYDYREIVKPKSENPDLGSLTAASQFDATKLNAAMQHVLAHQKAITEAGVPADRIFLLASSGLFEECKTEGERRLAEEVLCKRVRDEVGKDLDTVTVRQEARYEALHCLKPTQRKESLLIDVGGGNTKGGGFDDKGLFVNMESEYGSKTYTAKVEENDKPSNPRTVDRLRDEHLTRPLRAQVTDQPTLAAGKRVCLLGGIAWALTTYTHPTAVDDDRVPLTAADIDEFSRLASTRGQEGVRADIVKGAMKLKPEVGEKVKAEMASVARPFGEKKEARLRGGAEVLRALSEAYDFRRKELYFYRKGEHALILGYMADKSGVDKPTARK